jgi:hypothetical protein
LSGVDGPLQPAPTQTTAGLVVDDLGNGTLGGLWDGTFFGAGFNSAALTSSLFGASDGIFLEGTVSAVPVPAAAWLFGSALIGLAGIKRKK